MHLKWGNLKFFNVSEYGVGGVLFSERFFNAHQGSALIASRPFADGFVGDRLGTVEKAWLIDETSGKNLFYGDMEMTQITIKPDNVFYEFLSGAKRGGDGSI